MLAGNLVGATLTLVISPILSILVSAGYNYLISKHNRKYTILSILISTRADKLSLSHILALNSIELEFTGRKDKQVRDCWYKYSAYLNNDKDNLSTEEGTLLFLELLQEMGKRLGRNLNAENLRKHTFAPVIFTEKDYIKYL